MRLVTLPGNILQQAEVDALDTGLPDANQVVGFTIAVVACVGILAALYVCINAGYCIGSRQSRTRRNRIMTATSTFSPAVLEAEPVSVPVLYIEV